jgi:hypothetical protein
MSAAERKAATPQEWTDRIMRARQEISAICSGERRWTMCIPARPDSDSDLVLSDALDAAEEAIAKLRDGTEPEHECMPVGIVTNSGEGRDWWIGRITKPVAGWEHETHCLHIKTPRKHFVLMINAVDIAAIYCLLGCAEPQPEAAWRQHQIDDYRRAAGRAIAARVSEETT